MQIKYYLLALGLVYILYYGPVNLVVFLLFVASFLIGFAWLSSSDVLQRKSLDSAPPSARGIVSLVSQMWRSNSSSSSEDESTIITGSQELDDVLNEMLTFIIRDHILEWYSKLTNNEEFPKALKRSALQFLRTFCQRCSEANWIEFLTKRLPDDFASHIRLYRKTLMKLQQLTNKEDSKNSLNRIFFDLESDMEKTMCRERVCVSKTEEKLYLAKLSEMILYYFLDRRDYDNYLLRFLLKDILVSHVLLPVIDLVSDPDYIDQCIISWIRDDAYTSDYFLQSCRMSVSVEELEAVLEHVQTFSTVLKGFDSGGEEESSVRAQLASLEFLKKLCVARMQLLKGGAPLDKLDGDDVIIGVDDRNRHLYNMSYQDVMNKDLAVVAFLEFLTGRGVQFYMDMYLRIDSYRITASQKLGASLLNSKERPTAAVLDEVRKFARDIFLEFKDKALKAGSFDAVYLNNLLQKINRDPPSESIFDGLQNRLSDILEMDVYFGEFKRSPAYVALLRELDLLHEVNTQESPGNNDRRGSTSSELSLSQSTEMVFGENVQVFAEVTKAEVQREGSTQFAVYNIEVSQIDEKGNRRSWTIQRRFKNFDDLHQAITNADFKVPNLRLPSKRTFNSTSSETMNKRVQELNQYVNALLNVKLLQNQPTLKTMLQDFLRPGSLELRPGILARNVSAFITPLKTSVRSVIAVPDQMMDSFSRMISSQSRLSTSSWDHFTATSNEKVSHGLEAEDSTNLPVRIMLLMLDEVFDLRFKNQVVRRGIVAILMRFVKTFFGGHVNRKIIEKAQNFISASQMAILLRRLRDNWWKPAAKSSDSFTSMQSSMSSASPSSTSSSRKPTKVFSPHRDDQARLRTRIVCRTKLLGSISDELSHFLGKETTRQGVHRLFNMWHNAVLNRRFVYVLLEAAIRELLSTRQEHISAFYHAEHCPLRWTLEDNVDDDATSQSSLPTGSRHCHHSSHFDPHVGNIPMTRSASFPLHHHTYTNSVHV